MQKKDTTTDFPSHLLLRPTRFHPKASHLPISDKLLHFICFFIATLLFYCIWDVDTALLGSTPSQFWHRLPLLLTFFTCFLIGGVGSEFVQSLLPYKIFDWADILANLVGCSLGLWTSWHVEKRIREKRELRRLYTPLDFDAGEGGEAGAYEDGEEVDLERGGQSTSLFDEDDERQEQEEQQQQQQQQQQYQHDPPSHHNLFSIDDPDDAKDVWKDTARS